jgi:cytochrome c-type biogenesis protein CcsB
LSKQRNQTTSEEASLLFNCLNWLSILIKSTKNPVKFGNFVLIIKISLLGSNKQSVMKNILNFLFSNRLTGLLFVIFFIAIGSATFIEEAYDTVTAKLLVYDSFWLEMVIFLMMINFIGNIARYQLFRLEKLGTLVFHLSFIIIIIGAGITRYTGFEGTMPIREGATEKVMYSAEPFLQVSISDLKQRYIYDKRLYLSNAPVVNNDFDMEVEFKDNEPLTVSYKAFIKNAIERMEENQPEGVDMIQIVLGGQEGREELLIREGEAVNLGEIVLAYNTNEHKDAIIISKKDGQLMIQSPIDISRFSMPQFIADTIFANQPIAFKPMHLHRFANTQFVFKSAVSKAVKQLVQGGPNENGTDALIVNLNQGDSNTEMVLFGGNNNTPAFKEYANNGLLYRIGYGVKEIALPFSLKCKDFIFDTYPGSSMPMSYRSEVTVIDPRNKKEEDHSIFMNNVLDYDGYRFFQSSFDPDRKGTRLSVNHDEVGTLVTYFGYSFLTFGFVLAMFMRTSRFGELRHKIKELSAKRMASTLVVFIALFISQNGFSQHEGHNHNHQKDTTSRNHVTKAHADKLAKLIVLAKNGRYEPLHTLSYDLAHKLSYNEEYTLMDGSTVGPMRFFADLMVNPQYWKTQKIIYIKRNSGVQALIGLDNSEKYASFSDFFEGEFTYKLAKSASDAWQKDQAKRNVLDKEIMKVDERVNLMFMAFGGELLTIFPAPKASSGEWIHWQDSLARIPLAENPDASSITYQAIMWKYISDLHKATQTGDYTDVDKMLADISSIQRAATKEGVIPTKEMVDVEITYNDSNLFTGLRKKYGLLSLGLLLFALLDIIVLKKSSKVYLFLVEFPLWLLIGFLAILFMQHTYGLGIRWYLTGHAPWSNGFEALVTIAWGGLLAGFIFARYSKITTAATALLAFFVLMVAGFSQYDPQLTNLQPVLKSYWLNIHVLVIVVSYGFFGLGFILSLINLIISVFRNEKNQKRLTLLITELSHINEMTLIIGIALAAVGTFLGGVWANESWGRYWGWDQKETWALAIVMCYGFVLHQRLIPGFKGVIAFNNGSLWGFGSVIMTFVGVNYYLSKGLHSYAAGDTPAFPSWIWGMLAGLLILSVVAALIDKKLKKTR